MNNELSYEKIKELAKELSESGIPLVKINLKQLIIELDAIQNSLKSGDILESLDHIEMIKDEIKEHLP